MSMKSNISIPLSEIFTLGFLCLLFFVKGIGLYDGQTVFKIILVAALFCFAAKMLMTTYSLREFLIVGILLALGAATYLVSGEKGALISIMMVTILKAVPLERVFRAAFVTWTLSFWGMFLLSATGLVDSPFKIHERFGFGFLIRWGLGHSHPNVLHISYLTFAMLAIYVLGKRINLKWLLFLMLGNLYVFLYSLSTTGFIAVCFLLLLNLYGLFRQRLGMAEKVFVMLFLPLCLALSFLAPFVLKGWAFDIVNKLVNTRLELSRHFLIHNPVSLLGTRTATIMTHWFTMDNSYVFAYVAYGVIFFALVVLAYILIIRRYLKAQKGMELSLIIASLAAGITEPLLFNLSFKNIPLLFFGELIYDDKKKSKQKQLYFLPKKLREFSIATDSGVSGSIFRAGAWLGQKWADYMDHRRQMSKKSRCRLYLLSVAFALCVAVFCAFFLVRPDSYIAPTRHCDFITEDAGFYLEPGFNAEMENVKMLGHIDVETQVLKFSGHIVTLEWLRGIITAGILAGGFALFVAPCLTLKSNHAKIKE